MDVSPNALSAASTPTECDDLREKDSANARAQHDLEECLHATAFVGVTEVVRQSAHIVGSVHSDFFRLGAELSIGLEERSASSKTDNFQRMEKSGGPLRLWTVEVPLGAGGGGFLGANVPATDIESNVSVSEGRWESIKEGDGKFQRIEAWDSALLCEGDWLSIEEDGDCRVNLKVATEYLPSTSVLEAARRRATMVDKSTRDLLARLQLLQHDLRSCSRSYPHPS